MSDLKQHHPLERFLDNTRTRQYLQLTCKRKQKNTPRATDFPRERLLSSHKTDYRHTIYSSPGGVSSTDSSILATVHAYNQSLSPLNPFLPLFYMFSSPPTTFCHRLSPSAKKKKKKNKLSTSLSFVRQSRNARLSQACRRNSPSPRIVSFSPRLVSSFLIELVTHPERQLERRRESFS